MRFTASRKSQCREDGETESRRQGFLPVDGYGFTASGKDIAGKAARRKAAGKKFFPYISPASRLAGKKYIAGKAARRKAAGKKFFPYISPASRLAGRKKTH